MFFTYSSSKMLPPAQTRALTSEEALDRLTCAQQDHSVKDALVDGTIQVSVSSDSDLRSHSPYGSWMTMYFPIKKN
jgi:hypothetical protein